MKATIRTIERDGLVLCDNECDFLLDNEIYTYCMLWDKPLEKHGNLVECLDMCKLKVEEHGI